jgi:hypothetical protein
MAMLKVSLFIAAVFLVVKVIRTESGTIGEKLAYLGRAVSGKSIKSHRSAHDAYSAARRLVYAIAP